MKGKLPLLGLISIFVICPGLRAQNVQLDYSTYLGGTGSGFGNGIAVDENGCAYVTGRSSSTNFPLSNAYQSSYGGSICDAFASKLSSSGSILIYSTFLGGGSSDSGQGITVDTGYRAYLTGYTSSTDFPLENSYQPTLAGGNYRDAFITKLTSSGTALVYSTYLGGDDNDNGYGICLDTSGRAYVTGDCESTDFPVSNPYQSSNGGSEDAFVARLSSSGSSLIYSTYLGGGGPDHGYGIAVDTTNLAYVSGNTTSYNFPTKNSYQPEYGGGTGFGVGDAFLSKFTSSGSELVYSTYLGGARDDSNSSLGVDTQKCAYIGGDTSSMDFPTINAYQPSRYATLDVFISKFSSTGSTLFYSTYLGGDWSNYGGYLTVDSENCVYLTGQTFSNNFPTVNAYQSSLNGFTGDVFACKFSSIGSTLLYSTFLGGISEDSGIGIAVSSNRDAYITGLTNSSDFPTENAYQSILMGSSSAFITKLNFPEIVITPTPPATSTPPPTPSPTPSKTATPPPSPTRTASPPPGPTPSPQTASTATPVPTPYNPLDLIYSTYLGGDGADYGYAVEVDGAGCVYLCGETGSDDFPAINSYQSSREGSTDVFLSKFSSAGSTLAYSTYLGGADSDTGYDITLDASGCLYLTGKTQSGDFPTRNAYQADRKGWEDAFAVKLSSSGSELIYSTYLGGGISAQGYGIAVDSALSAYVSGHTDSEDFPTRNSYQASLAGLGGYSLGDAFVTKLTSSGSALAYSTYLGGSDDDESTGISIDSSGSVSVTGYTGSSDFPSLNGYQSSRAGAYDVFLSRLSSSGTGLVYSTYLGGSSWDYGGKVAVGFDGSAYICGSTASTNFPVVNPYQSSNATSGFGEDAFIARFVSSGSALIYSTYLGGADGDYAKGIGVDDLGKAYVGGYTGSDNFPTFNPYQPTRAGSGDVFVAGFSSGGAALFFSTYLGGSELDRAYGLARGPERRIYMTGYTRSAADFPLRNAYQSSYGGGYGDAFLVDFIFYPGTPTPTAIATPTPVMPTVTSTPISTPSPTPTNGGTRTPTVTPEPPSATPSPSPGSGRPSWIYDYNGDGTSDIAIFRYTSGLWAVRGITRVYFGGSSDYTVPGDYNGDGTTDIAIYRHYLGLWAIRGVTRVYFGAGSNADRPQSGDYNGDGTRDIGIFRESSGLWAIRGVTRLYFGGGFYDRDIPVPGYYKGTGRKDIAIFRWSSGLWALRGVSRIYFGNDTDRAVPGDYNGDGTWEPGVFRQSSGLWAIRAVTRSYFGTSSDAPVPADYNGKNSDMIGIFRPSSGLWAARGVTRVYFGGTGDMPVTR